MPLPYNGIWDDTQIWTDTLVWNDEPVSPSPNGGRWKGDPTNPVPDNYRNPINRSEKLISENRAEQVRRDNDYQKNPSVSLYDIDEAIVTQLSQLELQVKDTGKIIKVPCFYASPEKWKSAQNDGYLRDQQGKLILPAMTFKRVSSEGDESLPFFNRYLNASVIKPYSAKNAYTQFSILNKQNAPVADVYNITIPNYMVLTYNFIIWTEYVEQMNELVQKIQFNTKDYWGTKRGFKFRTKIASFDHTTEVETDDDRIIKSEFQLVVNGYILPDQIFKLDSVEDTTRKLLTPKKVIINSEVVSTSAEFKKLKKDNSEKWRNPTYPNLPRKEKIPTPPVSLINNGSIKIINQIIIKIQSNTSFTLPPPLTSNDPGTEGLISYDSDYYYLYTEGYWKRVPIVLFNASTNF